jgi:hypothetical protein
MDPAGHHRSNSSRSLLAEGGPKVLRASQFKLVLAQAVIFTPEEKSFSQPTILGTILAKYSDRYDGVVQAIPLPEDMPPELPRVVLQSKDEIWQLRGAPARVDSVWIYRGGAAYESGEIISKCAAVLEHYVRAANTRVGRLALVLTRVAEASDPARQLIDHFCNDKTRTTVFRRSENFEIHNHKRYRLGDGPEINSWVRCKTATLTDDERAVVVEQDLNTLTTALHQDLYGPDDIASYLRRAAAEAESICDSYFPEDN